MPIDILVADDEPHILRALSFVLKKEGFNVDVAQNGEDALRKIKEGRPRVVFLDLVMPKMTGIELCKIVKSDGGLRQTHVIILTCKGQELDRNHSLSAGADEFMTKPFSPKEVVTRVKTLFARG